jgi:hypothetical protein
VEQIKNGNRVSVKRLKIGVTAVMVLLTQSIIPRRRLMVEFIYRLACSQRSIDNADQVLRWRKVLVIDLRSDVRVGQKSDTPCPMINYIHSGSCHSHPFNMRRQATIQKDTFHHSKIKRMPINKTKV